MIKSKTGTESNADLFGAAKGISEGDKLDEVSGKIKGIFPMKQAGKTTVQNGTLTVDGIDIKFALWGDEMPQNFKGKVINILATGKKFGEIEYKISEYDGKNGHVREEVLSIGNGCLVEEVGGDVKPATGAPAQSRTTQPSTGFSLIEAAESIAGQHLIVSDMVRLTYAKKGYDEETLRAYTASVFILLDRAGQIVVGAGCSQEPRGDAQTPKQGQHAASESGYTYNPQNWAEAIIPTGSNKGKNLASIGNAAIKRLEEHRETGGFCGPFWSCVEQAAKDLALQDSAEASDIEGDDIPF